MKRIIIFTILSIGFIISSHGFNNEVLHYVISYKWGLIQKDAGEATLSLKSTNDAYNIVLSAKTKPWADKIFKVRDTLKSTIRKHDFRPLYYTKISHEGDKYGQDKIKYSYLGNTTFADCSRIRLKDGRLTETKISLSSTKKSYDMLSIFYYLRLINFDKLNSNTSIKSTIFSGKRVETITIKNIGIETITLRDKSKHKAYHIRFNFTTQGGKKSSNDMDTWISINGKIPLQLEGDLPIGKIKCYYVPQ